MILGCKCASARQNAQSSTSLSQNRDWRTCSGQKRGQPKSKLLRGLKGHGYYITLHDITVQFASLIWSWQRGGFLRALRFHCSLLIQNQRGYSDEVWRDCLHTIAILFLRPLGSAALPGDETGTPRLGTKQIRTHSATEPWHQVDRDVCGVQL